MLVRILVGLASIVVYLSPSERQYRREQKQWVMADRPTLGRRDFPDIESDT